MGSFCELVLSFDFREDTPPQVLAAFADLERPVPEGAFHGPAPDLPAPVEEPTDWWDPDWRETGRHDEFESEPWRHNWARPLAYSMSVATVPAAALSWAGTRRWNLSCRCSFKSWAEAIFLSLEWLGAHVDDRREEWQEDRPYFVGYIKDEAEPRPYLLWVLKRKLVMEDLNN